MHETSPWPPDLAGMLTQWPWPIFCAPLTLTQFTLMFQIFSTIRRTTTKPCIVLLLYVLTAGTLTWWPWPIFCAPMTLTYFASTFYISSTIRPTTIKPCKVLLLNVLTWQIPLRGDFDLYFGCSDFDIIYVNVPDLLKCKTSSHQTLHSASPWCTDSTGILTRWPWSIFCAPVLVTHFTSTFNISSTIRTTTIKPCIVLLLNVRTRHVPWLGDLDLYFALHWLLHLLRHPSIYLNCKAFNHQTLYSTSSRCTDSAGTLTWWPWPILCTPVTLTHFLCWCSVSPQV